MRAEEKRRVEGEANGEHQKLVNILNKSNITEKKGICCFRIGVFKKNDKLDMRGKMLFLLHFS